MLALRLLCFVSLIGACNLLQAQQNMMVTASFSNQTIKSIFLRLEQKYPVKFFFKEELLPRETIDIAFEHEPIIDATNSLLKGSGLQAFMFKDHAVIIGPQELIEETYSPTFYQAIQENEGLNQNEDLDAIIIGRDSILNPTGEAQIQAWVKGEENGKPLIGCLIEFLNLDRKIRTDDKGGANLTIPIGVHQLKINHPAYDDLFTKIIVRNIGEFSVELSPGDLSIRCCHHSISREREMATHFGDDNA